MITDKDTSLKYINIVATIINGGAEHDTVLRQTPLQQIFKVCAMLV